MSAWPGKYVIGLTGNIATGKSVVRKMLEHLGAYGIDADALAHRALAKQAPGYLPVVETFGKWILASDGQIDRSRLAKIVFSDAEALARLEAILHPLVDQAVDIYIRRSPHAVIVIEAIKILESGLAKKCDTLWVTSAPEEVQMARLLQKRGMSVTGAQQRIQAQPPQQQKLAAADVVIENKGSYEDTWLRVYAAWVKKFPAPEVVIQQQTPGEADLRVQRARPAQAAEIARLITNLSGGRQKMQGSDVMAAFGEKAFLLLENQGKICGLAGWKVENLVSNTSEVYVDASIPFAKALKAIMSEVERASRELQCEISLLFLPADALGQDNLAKSIGYQPRSIQSLGVRAWEEAAYESMPAGAVMLFKQLRQDRVLRPV